MDSECVDVIRQDGIGLIRCHGHDKHKHNHDCGHHPNKDNFNHNYMTPPWQCLHNYNNNGNC